MTVRQLLDELALVKPHAYPESELMNWLTHYDGIFYDEVLSNYPDTRGTLPPTYTEDTQELMLKPPFTQIYLLLLMAMVDFFNGDFEAFNNDGDLFAAEVRTWADSMSRTHKADTVPLSVLS